MKSRPPVEKLPVVTIWTDGSALLADRTGGWAAVLKHMDKVKIIWGHLEDTTSQRAELTAAIRGLQELKSDCIVALCSDSQYLVNGMRTWRHQWACRDWLKADGKPVVNQDLWEELIELDAKHEVQWSWQRGHNDNDPWNTLADEYANHGRTGYNEYQSKRLTVGDVIGGRDE